MSLTDKRSLTDKQQALCDESPHDYSDLSALFLNCTLKPTPTGCFGLPSPASFSFRVSPNS